MLDVWRRDYLQLDAGAAMRCPSCGSEDVIRVAAMYEQGRGAISAQSAGVGVGAGGLGFGVASTSGTTTTYAAQRLRPPFRPIASGAPAPLFALGAFILAFLSCFIAPWGEGQPDALAWIHVAVFVGIMATGIVAMVRKISRDSRELDAQHSLAMKRWHALWYCRRCAHSGDQSSFEPARPLFWQARDRQRSGIDDRRPDP